MTKTTKWIIGGTLAVMALAAGLVVWRVFGGETPAEAALASLAPATIGSTSDSEDGAGDGFDGAWAADTASGSVEDGSATFAGYRIEEELGGIGANTAVGRTREVDVTMTVEGTEVTVLEVTVDMTTLQSDDSRRDGQLAERGLETNAFPTATFVLTEPIELGSEPGAGEAIETSATGELTLHGVTREVEVPVQAQWTGEQIEVVATFDVALSDYDIEPPTGFLVLSIADVGSVELHLLLEEVG